MDAKLKNYFQGVQNHQLNKLNQEKTEGISILQQQVNHLNASVSDLQDELRKKEQQLEEALDDAEFFKALLSKPMHEIAAKHGGFKQTYEKQQELMADWMVSQKAFKELAIQFGQQLGLTKEEVLEKGKQGEMAVLDSKNNPEHNTNANNSNIIKPHVDKLKKKILGK